MTIEKQSVHKGETMLNKKFVVAVATSLTLMVGIPAAFASDSSDFDRANWSLNFSNKIGWSGDSNSDWKMKREAIRKTFRTVKENIKVTFETARELATTDQARNVAEVAFTNALSTVRQAYQDALMALGTPTRKVDLARQTNKPATGSSKATSKIEDILALVNQRRAAAGLGSVIECSALNQSAQAHSQDMYARGFFSHTNPDGNAPTDRIRLTGYLNSTTSWSTGENIAKGYVDVASVMAGWMNSPGHRANILNSSFTHLGVGVVKTRPNSSFDGFIWTQNFGSGGTC